MKTSDQGINFIKSFEGLELEAYQDIAGIWTIGYGHTETAKEGMVISEAQAEELLRADLDRFEKGVLNHLKWAPKQHRFDALVSFAFNVGLAGFARSTALKRLNAGNIDAGADALLWWDKAKVNGVHKRIKGLTRRRQQERELFLHGDYDMMEGVVEAPGKCSGD